MTTPLRPALMIESRDAAASADVADAADPMEKIDAAEPIEPTDNTEPIEPIDSNEPRHPMHNTESSDHSDNFEFAPTGTIEHRVARPSPSGRPNPGAGNLTAASGVYL
jgi:hypothetical protein